GWARERERLARGHDLAALARNGLEFTRHQFDNDEALRELAELGLDVGEYDTVHEFLARRAKEGTLEEHGELVALLGLLEYRQGNMAGAIAQLSKLRGRQRFPLVLGRAMEATGAWQPAMAEYGRVVETEAGPGERARTLGLLRSLDVHGRWRARVRRLETAS